MNDMNFVSKDCWLYATCSCKCDACRGTGNTGRPYPCKRCGSTGRVRSLFGRVKECGTCHAQKEPCASCGSTGRDQRCSRCHRTGKVQCENCLGQGFIDVEAALNGLDVVPNRFHVFGVGLDDSGYYDDYEEHRCEVRMMESLYQQLRLVYRQEPRC